MTIATISYKRLINTGNYENFAIEMTATLAPDEEPAAAARALVEQVHAAIRAELADHADATWRWPDLFPKGVESPSEAPHGEVT